MIDPAKTRLPLLLGGPPGSGKSTLGEYSGRHNWLHLEADIQPPKVGIDELRLRGPWDQISTKRDAFPFAEELDRLRIKAGADGVILTLASYEFRSELLAVFEKALLFRFLAGPAIACRESFVTREQGRDRAESRAALEAHWEKHNAGMVRAIVDPNYQRFLIPVLRGERGFIPIDETANTLIRLLESLLLARMNSSPNIAAVFTAKAAPKDNKTAKPLAFGDWKLVHMIEVAHELKWVTKSAKDIGNVLRDFRNYIHPHKEFTDKIAIGADDAKMFWEVTKLITRQVLGSVGNSP